VCIRPVAIAQTTTGTSKMRANVMRLGILNSTPARPRVGWHFPRPDAFAIPPEYIGDRAIAHVSIPTYPRS
jgi:hypothetical protein